jgi:beta-lactamase regulating signal transducer with metallopeptidase domain
METINSLVPIFLLNALWQATLVAGVAAFFCAWLMRKVHSARNRHALWVAALLLSVGLPLLSLLRFDESNLRLPLSSLSATAHSFPASATAAINQTNPIKGSAIWLESFLRRNKHSVSFLSPLASTLNVCYLLFLLYRINRLLQAWRRTKCIRKSAYAPAASAKMEAIAEQCCNALQMRKAVILCSSQITGALTVGTHRPIIILSESLFQESSEQLLASVLAHELAHIRRRDFSLNFIYELLYLPISFHPAAALVRRQINRTRELVCDEIVAERVVDAKAYARSLIRLANSALAQSHPNYTLGVFDADILEERIMRLIERKRFSGVRAGKLFVLIAALSLSVMSVAATVFSFQVGRYVKTVVAGAESPIVGAWHADWPQHPGLPALDLTVSSDAGKLSGTVIFYWSLYKEGGSPVAGQVEVPLIDPKFDGTTLSFKTKSKRDDQEKAFAMRLVRDNELQLISDESKLIIHLLKIEKSANTPASVRAAQVGSAMQNLIVGDWNLRAYGSTSTGEETESPGLVLKLKMLGENLTGTAISWKEVEPKQSWQKVEWPLIEPKFDGHIFSFKVSNGEEILAGELKLIADRFEGEWHSSKSMQNGKLKMTKRD